MALASRLRLFLHEYSERWDFVWPNDGQIFFLTLYLFSILTKLWSLSPLHTLLSDWSLSSGKSLRNRALREIFCIEVMETKTQAVQTVMYIHWMAHVACSTCHTWNPAPRIKAMQTDMTDNRQVNPMSASFSISFHDARRRTLWGCWQLSEFHRGHTPVARVYQVSERHLTKKKVSTDTVDSVEI